VEEDADRHTLFVLDALRQVRPIVFHKVTERCGKTMADEERMVGAEGFEPPTLCSQSRCATRLRYAPTSVDCIARMTGVGAARAVKL
jgi:hypothetical protein